MSENAAQLKIEELEREYRRDTGLLKMQIESLRVELKRRVDYRWSVPDEERLERMLRGALMHVINMHGDITRSLVGSAAKRLIGIMREPFGEARATIDTLRADLTLANQTIAQQRENIELLMKGVVK